MSPSFPQPSISLPDFTVRTFGTTRDATAIPHRSGYLARTALTHRIEPAQIDVGTGMVFDGCKQPVACTAFMIDANNVPYSERKFRLGDKEVFVSYNAGWRNYYHFLIQSAFSTWLLLEGSSGDGGQFIFPDVSARHKEILALCGVDGPRVLFYHKNATCAVAAATIIDTTYADYVYMPSPLLRDFGSFLAREAGVRRRTAKRIYVSRRDSKNRKLVNETELEHALAARGFVVLSLSDLSLRNQMQAFRSAEIVVAPHGAGLANCIFCQPETAIVELAPESYTNTCFLRISQVMGLRHHLFVFADAGSHARQQDIEWTVPVEEAVSQIDSVR